MATLDNEIIFVGNKAYDIIYGYGEVIGTNFGEIQMRFADGRRISYNYKGEHGPVKRLFWHNPIVVLPTKNNDFWQMLVVCITQIYEFLLKKPQN